jgi:hypothetical protein
MGKASSAKKIKRVQQAGASRAPGQRRNLGYPALIAAIIIVGSVLVFFARDERQATASVAPTSRDHWHAAFGIDICGEFQAEVNDVGPDRLGIHTHGDGLIHIHPFGSGASGPNATFGKFADQVGLTVGDGTLTLPDGTTYTDGDACPNDEQQTGRVALYVWPPQANDKTEPRIVTRNINGVRFTEDGQIMVLAFAPEDSEPRLPPSLPALANPSDEEPVPGSVNGSTPPPTTAGGEPPAAPTSVGGEAPAAPPTTAAGEPSGTDTSVPG